MSSTSTAFKIFAASQKLLPSPLYQTFVQTLLTPRIYKDHVDAYRDCGCPCGPAPYPSWIGVTTVPIQPCSLVGYFIKQFGPCNCAPGRW
jgi:hypothetical protein